MDSLETYLSVLKTRMFSGRGREAEEKGGVVGSALVADSGFGRVQHGYVRLQQKIPLLCHEPGEGTVK